MSGKEEKKKKDFDWILEEIKKNIDGEDEWASWFDNEDLPGIKLYLKDLFSGKKGVNDLIRHEEEMEFEESFLSGIVCSSNYRIMKWLIENGADIHQIHNSNGDRTILDYSSTTYDDGNTDLQILLLNSGISPKLNPIYPSNYVMRANYVKCLRYCEKRKPVLLLQSLCINKINGWHDVKTFVDEKYVRLREEKKLLPSVVFEHSTYRVGVSGHNNFIK